MEKSNRKELIIQWAACLLLGALSFTVFYALAGRPHSDISIHATWASEGSFLNPRSFLHHQVHPLWHIGMGLLLLTGMPLNVAAALSTMLWKVSLLWIAWGLSKRLLGRERSPWAATACALMAVLVSTVVVPGLNPDVYLSIGATPNPWHSPTQIAVLPFSIICVWLMAQSYVRFEQLGPQKGILSLGQWLWMAALFAISALAKPSFLQAFLPGAAVYFLVQWIRHPNGSRYFWQLILAMLPALAVIAVQFYFYFLNASDTGIGLTLSWQKAGTALLQCLLMCLFPLYVLLTDRERPSSPLTALSLAYLASALVETIVLGEQGRRAADGNFVWALMGAAFLLWAVTLPRFFRRQRGRRPNVCGIIGGGLLGWHLLSGLYYVVYLLTHSVGM